MKQRILTALVLVAVCAPPLFFGGFSLTLLLFACVGIGSYEVLDVRKDETDWPLVISLFLLIVLMYNIKLTYYPVALGLFIIGAFTFVIFNQRYSVVDVSYVFMMTFMFTLTLRSINLIYTTYGWKLMFYVAIACYVCDAGAYFVGSRFGKHKMIPRISPKKTWEGAIGGYVFSAVLSFAFASFFLMDEVVTLPMVIIGSLCLPIVAMIGDLAFSSIKRYYGVKDFGTLFPGHGGILDRIDSLIFCLVFFYSVLLIFWGM